MLSCTGLRSFAAVFSGLRFEWGFLVAQVVPLSLLLVPLSLIKYPTLKRVPLF